MATVLRAYTATGTFLGELPDQQGLATQVEHNGPGSIKFDYPADGINAGVLADDDVRVAVVDGGVEQDDRWFLEDDGDDPTASTGDARPITCGGRGQLAVLEQAVVYPEAYTTPGMALNGMDPHHAFGSSSPGKIMSTLIARAQARGALPGIEVDFTSEVDSAGTPWPTLYSVTYDVGLDYHAVLLAMTDNGWCDTRMVGNTLRLFVPDTVCGVDRPDAVMRLARDITQAPRARSRRTIRSTMLGLGDSGTMAEVVDTTAEARYGRREGYDGRGGVTDVGTITAIAQADLTQLSDAHDGITLAIQPDSGTPIPGQDFAVGDFVRYDQRRIDSTTLEPLRVRTIATTWDANTGAKSWSIELNDLWLEQTLILSRRVDGIVNGAQTGGSIPAPVPDPTTTNDTVPPGRPTAVVVTSAAYIDPTGAPRAQATITWTAATANQDGSVYNDHSVFRLGLQYPDLSSTWTPDQEVANPPVFLSGLPVGTRLIARVVDVDTSNNASLPAFSDPVTLASDTTPPPVPAAPTVTPYLSGLQISWNGLGSAAESMPADAVGVQVHISQTSGFTPSTATRVDLLAGPGSTVVAVPVYGVAYYVRLVSLDRSGNTSAPSAQASAAARQVVGTDLGGRPIGLDQVQFSDTGNLVSDGSFEYAETRARLAATGPWLAGGKAWSTDAYHGGQALQLTAQAGTNELPIAPEATVQGGATYWLRAAYKTPASVNGTFNLVARFRLASGSTTDVTAWSVTLAQTTYVLKDAQVVAPAGAVGLTVVVQAVGTTTGSWTVDQVEARTTVSTAIIQTAAITTAKIAALAVNDAQIGSLSATKITTGTLAADVVVGARIKTADTGSRVELGPTGLKAYNASNALTVSINSDGTATFAGTISASTVTGDVTVGGGGGAYVRLAPAGNFFLPAAAALFSTGVTGLEYAPGAVRAIGNYSQSTDSGQLEVQLIGPVVNAGNTYPRINLGSQKDLTGTYLPYIRTVLRGMWTIDTNWLVSYGMVDLRYTVSTSGNSIPNPENNGTSYGTGLGSQFADKILLYSQGATGYGFGVPVDGQLVAFLDSTNSNAHFVIKKAVGSGMISSGGTATANLGPCAASAYHTSSVQAGKRHIRTLDGGLELVRQLRPVRYRGVHDDQPGVSFVAEEVERVLPEVCGYDGDGGPLMGLDLARITTVLAAAVQELDVQVRELRGAA
jgi:hypothetical protein